MLQNGAKDGLGDDQRHYACGRIGLLGGSCDLACMVAKKKSPANGRKKRPGRGAGYLGGGEERCGTGWQAD